MNNRGGLSSYTLRVFKRLQENPGLSPLLGSPLGCFLIYLSRRFIPPRLSEEHSRVGVSAPQEKEATLRRSVQADSAFSSLKCLDPVSGRQIPAIWHGACVTPEVLFQKPSTENGINRSAIVFLVWLPNQIYACII